MLVTTGLLKVKASVSVDSIVAREPLQKKPHTQNKEATVSQTAPHHNKFIKLWQASKICHASGVGAK